MHPYLIAGIVAFVIFDALVVITVFSLGDLQRHAQAAADIRGQMMAALTAWAEALLSVQRLKPGQPTADLERLINDAPRPGTSDADEKPEAATTAPTAPTAAELTELQRRITHAVRNSDLTAAVSSAGHLGDATRAARRAQDRYDAHARHHDAEVRRMRDLTTRFPWRWSAAVFRLKLPDDIPESSAALPTTGPQASFAPRDDVIASPASDDLAFEVLLNQLLPRLGAPLLAYMLAAGPGVESDPGIVVRWASGKEKPLGLAVDQRVRTIHEVVSILSTKLRDRRIRRWFGTHNTRANNLAPSEAIRRGYLDVVLHAAHAEVNSR
jgi:hypothetical protein